MREATHLLKSYKKVLCVLPPVNLRINGKAHGEIKGYKFLFKFGYTTESDYIDKPVCFC